MAGGEVMPDTVSYNTALKACGNAMQLQKALQVRPGSSQKGTCADPVDPEGSTVRHVRPALHPVLPIVCLREAQMPVTQLNA